MGHVEGVVAKIQFSTSPRQTIYGYEKDIDGVWVRRRMSFSRDTLTRLGLPNMVAWINNPDPADASHRSGPLSMAYLVLASPWGRFLSPPAQRLALTGHEVPGVPYGPVKRSGVLAHLANIMRQPVTTACWALSFGVGRFLVRGRRAPGFFIQRPSNCYPLMFHGEHLPAYNSRVVLDESTDQLGMRRLRIQMQFTEDDVRGVVRAHDALDRFLRDEGIGELEYLEDDVAAAVRRRIGGGFHQAGTTRMSADPEAGVVNANLAVHGYHNLYVASSSVFVTSGQANSTFMIVALAVRLADLLRTKLGRSSAAVETD
jgi:choline dehydrogenase-like flavoprotein